MKRFLTLHQYKVLKALSGRQQWSVTEIAHELHISKAAATKCVKRLERHGVVSRSDNLLDRRGSIIRMTQEGRQAVNFLSQQVYLSGPIDSPLQAQY